jgi:hypothetical protein
MGSEDSIFRASLEAFAAIGVPTTFLSAFMGFMRTVRRESAERVGDGINYGLAVGFVPGAILATAVFTWELWA